MLLHNFLRELTQAWCTDDTQFQQFAEVLIFNTTIVRLSVYIFNASIVRLSFLYISMPPWSDCQLIFSGVPIIIIRIRFASRNICSELIFNLENFMSRSISINCNCNLRFRDFYLPFIMLLLCVVDSFHFFCLTPFICPGP